MSYRNRLSGAAGEDTILKVPCGTEIRDVKTGIILGDLTKDKQSLTVAYGGRGGHGNAYYLSNQNRAPESFTEGKDGEIWEVQLELKLLAEVGIIGLSPAPGHAGFERMILKNANFDIDAHAHYLHHKHFEYCR